MKWSAPALILCICTPLKAQPQAPAIASVQYHAELAAWHLSVNVSERDWKYTKFLSWYAYPETKLADAKKLMCWWIHQLSFSQNRKKPLDVPNSGGLLQVIDIRDYNWNTFAWEKVASEEPYFQEPAIDNKTAVFLRSTAGGMGLQDARKLAEKGKYPVVTVVWAPWLFRQTIETDRSTAYYDLLFAQFRFKAKKVVNTDGWEVIEKRVYHPGGDFHYPDDSGRISRNLAAGWYRPDLKFKKKGELVSTNEFEFVDFPRNLDDWNDAFGITETAAFLKKRKLNLKHGAVVAGSLDDPVKGSIVARSNRVIEIIRGPIGYNMRTFDVASTAKNDFLETSPEVVVAEIPFDAGEALSYLPNGGQAGLLFNAQGTRIEKADTAFAHNKVDPRYVDVRTMMGCVVCHGPDGGFIPPQNLIEDLQHAGVTVKIKDRNQRNLYEAFFLGWQKQIDLATGPYLDLLTSCTVEQNNPDDKGWDGTTLVKNYLELRNWYDDPVTPAQAALEMGMPLEAFKQVAVKSGSARLAFAVQDVSMPREVWEKTRYRESILLYDSMKP